MSIILRLCCGDLFEIIVIGLTLSNSGDYYLVSELY